jgi:hypothetical protein
LITTGVARETRRMDPDVDGNGSGDWMEFLLDGGAPDSDEFALDKLEVAAPSPFSHAAVLPWVVAV